MIVVLNQFVNAVRDDASLAGTSPSNHQERPFEVGNGFNLPFIQTAQKISRCGHDSLSSETQLR
jgi:hypothetical protein